MGSVTDGVVLGLYSSCGGHQFSFTAGGSLQHVGSKKCVNTKSGVSINDMLTLNCIIKGSETVLERNRLSTGLAFSR